jgi:hypothetical protein
MRHHAHPAVRALAAFLSNKANYLAGDRFTVRHIRHLANYVDLNVHPAYACRRILIDSRPQSGPRTRATQPYQYSRDDIPLYPWEVTYVLSRNEAIAQWVRQRYGRRDAPQLVPAMQQQHHTFDLAA